MKKVILVALSAAVLSACTLHTDKVDVYKPKANDQTVQAAKPQAQVQKDPFANLPNNVRAICRDGSYSTASSDACSNNGGVAVQRNHYFSE